MQFSILTLFPEFFQAPLKTSLIGKAQEKQKIKITLKDLRPYGKGKHRHVDDSPYGGGPGMVIMAPVLEAALSDLLGGDAQLLELEASVENFRRSKKTVLDSWSSELPFVVYLSPQGILWNAKEAKKMTKVDHVVLICGHYEGIDQRAIDAFVHQEISVGDYILTGGEPAALVLLDSISRFIPDVVGSAESVAQDTFEPEVGLKYPVFTKPSSWRGRSVPEPLLSGNHKEIAIWRQKQGLEKTLLRRPDLLPENPKS